MKNLIDKTRGQMEAWDFRQYVLGLIYYKNTNTGLSFRDFCKQDDKMKLIDLSRITDEQINVIYNNLPDSTNLANLYEELTSWFSSNAGKSGGEYYTPTAVCELIKELAGDTHDSVYDPTCGTGSLLKHFKGKLYGQEFNEATYNFCRMNLELGGREYDIRHGDTLQEPKHKGMKFDLVVANPPYSIKWEQNDRWEIKAPKSKGDWAFVQHILEHMKGKAYVIMFPGTLYRGGTEKKIREEMIPYLTDIYILPDKLFFGTTIAVNLLVLDINKSEGITFHDCSKMFKKAGKQNEILIEEVIKDKGTHITDIDDVDLSVNRYIDMSDKKESINIGTVNKELEELEINITKLRKEIKKVVDMIEGK